MEIDSGIPLALEFSCRNWKFAISQGQGLGEVLEDTLNMMLQVSMMLQGGGGGGGRFKNSYELLNLRALKISIFNKNHISPPPPCCFQSLPLIGIRNCALPGMLHYIWRARDLINWKIVWRKCGSALWLVFEIWCRISNTKCMTKYGYFQSWKTKLASSPSAWNISRGWWITMPFQLCSALPDEPLQSRISEWH